MIEIDGSYGEGGGQILRTSVALSALTNKDVMIKNIRAGRKNPGIQPQHLNSIKAVAELCDAKVEGLSLGSEKIIFRPGKIESKNINIDIGTAGSIALVLHALLPAAIYSKKEFEFEIIGGTHVLWSPPIEHFQHIFLDYLSQMGLEKSKLNFNIEKYGFYPKGGGKVKMNIKPVEIKPLEVLERGEFKHTDIQDSIASLNLKKANVAERQIEGFKKVFGKSRYENITCKYVDALSAGSAVHAHNSYENCKIGAEALGEIGKKAEKVGEECAKRLLTEIKADSTVDSHASDQLIPYLALYGGKIKIPKMTGHLKTNIWVCEKFLNVKFKIEKNIISCRN